jgi:hypothetical protein
MAGGLLFEWIDERFKRAWNTQQLELPVDRRRLWRNPLTNEEYFGVLAADPVTPALKARGGGIRTAIDPEALVVAVPPAARRFVIGVDARPGNGGGLPGTAKAAPAADVAFRVGPSRATVMQAGSWEPTGAQYAASDGIPAAAAWQPARLLISHPLRRPDTGQQLPARVATLGPLAVTRSHGTAVIRLPWALLGFADPSRRRIYTVNPGGVSFSTVSGVRVFVVAGKRTTSTRRITWPTWNSVRFTERRKASWPALKSAFAALTR